MISLISLNRGGNHGLSFEEVDIKDICGEIALADIYKDASDVVLIFDLGSPSVIVKTDERRVMQVISNFVNNAIKFTTKGSITIYYEIEGDFIRVCVKDTGIGISAENQRRIFERFIKVDTFQQGTGLGLTISRTIIEALGGKIGVDSEEGVVPLFGSLCLWRQNGLILSFHRISPSNPKKRPVQIGIIPS